MTLNPSNPAALIQLVKDKDIDVFNALQAMLDELVGVKSVITEKAEVLNRRKSPSDLEKVVYPRGTNPPLLAQPFEGLTFFNTTRSRFQKSVNSFQYFDYPCFESCRIHKSADVAIANNTLTALTFDEEYYDRYEMHSLAAVTNRITIPLDGVYLVGANIRWASNSAGDRLIGIRINGANFLCADSRRPAATAGRTTDQCCSTIWEFTTGDYIEVLVLQDSGGNLDVLNVDDLSAIFYAHKLSGYAG